MITYRYVNGNNLPVTYRKGMFHNTNSDSVVFVSVVHNTNSDSVVFVSVVLGSSLLAVKFQLRCGLGVLCYWLLPSISSASVTYRSSKMKKVKF